MLPSWLMSCSWILLGWRSTHDLLFVRRHFDLFWILFTVTLRKIWIERRKKKHGHLTCPSAVKSTLSLHNIRKLRPSRWKKCLLKNCPKQKIFKTGKVIDLRRNPDWVGYFALFWYLAHCILKWAILSPFTAVEYLWPTLWVIFKCNRQMLFVGWNPPFWNKIAHSQYWS